MAHSRGSHRAFGRSGSDLRRKTSWEVGPGSSTPVVLTGSGSTILGSGIAPTIPGLTLVRTRGLLGLTLNTAAAAGDGYTGALGIGVVTASAFAIGVTAVPTPLTDAGWDGWLYHEFFDVRAGDRTAGDSNWEAAIARYTVDSKAMRKIEDEEKTVFAVLEVVEQGTAQVEVSFDSRVLVKLP